MLDQKVPNSPLNPPIAPHCFLQSLPKSFELHPNWFNKKMHLIILCNKATWQWCNMQFSLFTRPLHFLPLLYTGTETVVKLDTCGWTWCPLSGPLWVSLTVDPTASLKMSPGVSGKVRTGTTASLRSIHTCRFIMRLLIAITSRFMVHRHLGLCHLLLEP